MATVNPPPLLRIPKFFAADREINDFIEDQNTIIWQLWRRTGGNNDLVEDGQKEKAIFRGKTNKNTALINEIKLKEFEIVSTTEDITTAAFQIILCKNTKSINVTLDPQAVEHDEVHIKRRGSSIRVIGSIDGFTNRTINVKNYSMHLVFDGIDWSEI